MNQLFASDLTLDQSIFVEIGKARLKLGAQGLGVVLHQIAVLVERHRSPLHRRLGAELTQNEGDRLVVQASKQHGIRACADVVQKIILKFV